MSMHMAYLAVTRMTAKEYNWGGGESIYHYQCTTYDSKQSFRKTKTKEMKHLTDSTADRRKDQTDALHAL